MSIKPFSKQHFIEVAKDILLHDEFIAVRNADKLNENTSFHDVLDITSLDIAELIIAIEEKFHVNMDDVITDKIDSINDLYEAFVKCIYKMRKTNALNVLQKQK